MRGEGEPGNKASIHLLFIGDEVCVDEVMALRCQVFVSVLLCPVLHFVQQYSEVVVLAAISQRQLSG